MAQPKHLAHRADAAIRFQQLLPLRVVARHAGRKLAAVLHVQQHPRDQPRNLVRPLRRAKRTHGLARQMIHGGQAALVMKFAHEMSAHRCSECRRAEPRLRTAGGSMYGEYDATRRPAVRSHSTAHRREPHSTGAGHIRARSTAHRARVRDRSASASSSATRSRAS